MEFEECEEMFIHKLSKENCTEFSDCLFQKQILSRIDYNQYKSLDHRSIEQQELKIRYLLQLVSVQVKGNKSLWEAFLNVLVVRGWLKHKELVRLWDKESILALRCRSNEIIVTREDLSSLAEFLIPVSPQWENLGIALDLLKHEIDSCTSEDIGLSLYNILQCWESRESSSCSGATLKKLVEALRSQLVNHGRMAQKLNEQFPSLLHSQVFSMEPETVDQSIKILNQSCEVKVSDGKSTLMFVQASSKKSLSYQWKKNGIILSNNSAYSGVHKSILLIKNVSQGFEGNYTCMVSNIIGKVQCSEITLEIVYSALKETLLNLYSAQTEVPPGFWPPLINTDNFIQLNLWKSNSKKTCYNCSMTGEKTCTDTEINYDQMFSKYCEGEIIVITGRPGAGKTALVNKLAKDWTKGITLAGAKLVLLISLPNFCNENKEETLSSMIRHCCNRNIELAAEEIENSHGEGVCFIMDGLDEYHETETSNSMVYKLTKRTYLTKSMIVVSSRPGALSDLKRKNQIQKFTELHILGFKKDQVYEYIAYYPFERENTDRKELIEYLESNQNIFDITSIPLLTAMVCFLHDNEVNIPGTQTKIYTEVVMQILQRSLLSHDRAHDQNIQISSLEDMKGKNKTHFDQLCYLAYITLFEGDEFDYSSISIEASLGLITKFYITPKSGYKPKYQFLHASFQEFLAAYYVANLDEEKQMNFIKEQLSNFSSTFCCFYFGLVKSGLDYIDCKLSYIIKETCDTLELLRYAFESQKVLVCNEIVRRSQGVLDLSTHTLSRNASLVTFYSKLMQSDLPVLTFVLSKSEIKKLCLPLGKITLLYLERGPHTSFSQLETLNIKESLDSVGMKHLASAFKFCGNLLHAELKLEDICIDAITHISNISRSVKQLKSLTLTWSTSSVGISTLLKELHHMKNTTISLAFEKLEHHGVLEVARGVIDNSSLNLELFRLSNCVLNPAVKTLNTGLRHLTSIRHLSLSANNLCGGSFTYLASAVKCLTELLSLDLSNNQMGSDGAASLANTLKHLSNLTHLNLSNNNIGVDGAWQLAYSFSFLKSLKILYIFSNNLDVESSISLLKALKNIDSLNKVDLGKLDHSLDSMQTDDLVNAIQHFKNERTLKLEDNNYCSTSQNTME